MSPLPTGPPEHQRGRRVERARKEGHDLPIPSEHAVMLMAENCLLLYYTPLGSGKQEIGNDSKLCSSVTRLAWFQV